MYHLTRAADQVIHALIPGSGNRNNRNPQTISNALYIDLPAVRRHYVHHIERENHRNIQIQKLQRQIEVAFYIGGIDDIYNSIRSFFNQEIW